MLTYEDEIGELRRSNDRLNVEIVEKIARWVEAAVRIGAIERARGLSNLESSVYDHVRSLAGQHRLDAEGVERIFREIASLHSRAEGGGYG